MTTSVDVSLIAPSATLVIFVLPALIPSLPIVTVVLLTLLPFAAGCVFVISTPSPVIFIVVDATSVVPLPFVIDVMPRNVFAIATFNPSPLALLVTLMLVVPVVSVALRVYVSAPWIFNAVPKSRCTLPVVVVSSP